jgi:hypothetical protein
MVSDQSDPEVVYKAHPASGILESLDSGKTWRVITDKTSSQGWSGGKFRGKKLKNMRMSIWSDGDRKILYAGLLSEDLIGLIRGDYNKTGGVWTWRSLPLPFTIEKDGIVGLNPKEDEEEEEGGGQGDVHFSITVDNRDPGTSPLQLPDGLCMHSHSLLFPFRGRLCWWRQTTCVAIFALLAKLHRGHGLLRPSFPLSHRRPSCDPNHSYDGQLFFGSSSA